MSDELKVGLLLAAALTLIVVAVWAEVCACWEGDSLLRGEVMGLLLLALPAFLIWFVRWFIPACDRVGIAYAKTFTPEQRQAQLDAAVVRGRAAEGVTGAALLATAMLAAIMPFPV